MTTRPHGNDDLTSSTLLNRAREASENSLEMLRQSIDGRIRGHAVKRQLSLILDTDKEIGKDTDTPETRVGFTPEHAAELLKLFGERGVKLTIHVVEGAGALAGFGDDQYRNAGCSLIAKTKEALSSLEPAPDVVHALKEPAAHEGDIPGMFIRIGATHLVNFDKESGMAYLFRSRNFSSVLDGGATGECSYIKSGTFPKPIVSTMSIFAGKWAALHVNEGTAAASPDTSSAGEKKVVIVGGGVAGQSAIESMAGKYAKIYVLEVEEKVDSRRDSLKSAAGTGTEVEVQPNNEANLSEALRGAVGLVFAHTPDGVSQAPQTASLAQIATMARGAVVVDISIDQGGSIINSSIREGDSLKDKIDKNVVALRETGQVYCAEQNMPRKFPHQASEAHGSAVLPYLVGLLSLCAIRGGAERATEYIFKHERKKFKSSDELPTGLSDDYFSMIVQDLRNGIVLVEQNGELKIAHEKIEGDKEVADRLQEVWHENGSPPQTT